MVFAPRLDDTTLDAFAMTPSLYDDTNSPGPFVMVNWNEVSSDRYTVAHEILHILLDASHDYSGGSSPIARIGKYQSDFNDKKTIWGGTNQQATIDASRRIYQEMAEDLLESQFMKNP